MHQGGGRHERSNSAVVRPISMSSKTQVVCVASLRSFDEGQSLGGVDETFARVLEVEGVDGRSGPVDADTRVGRVEAQRPASYSGAPLRDQIVCGRHRGHLYFDGAFIRACHAIVPAVHCASCLSWRCGCPTLAASRRG